MAQPKATTPEAVLLAAAEVFHEKGYASATLDDIAERAGISKPTVYRYAESKQWLLDQIVETVSAGMKARSAEVIGNSYGIQRLRRIIQVTFDTSIASREFHFVAILQYGAASPKVARRFNKWRRDINRRMADTLQQCVDEGSLDLPGDIRSYAMLLQAMIVSTHRWFQVGRPLTTEQLTEHVMHLLSAAPRDRLIG